MRAWTLVQHSAAGYRGDTTFARAVETRCITRVDQAKWIEAAGGLVLDTYDDAEDLAYKENYPDDHDGLVPGVLGSFSRRCVDGLRVYLPMKVDATESA